jgi:O-antigen/teichoic acid export membrane protein
VTVLKKEIKKLTRQSIAYSLGDFINYIINFLLFPVYMKMLTPRELGILLLVTLFGTLMRMLLRLGLNDGFMRLYFDHKKVSERKELLGANYWGLLFINIIVFIPLWFLIDKIARFFLYDSALSPEGMSHLLSTYTPLFAVMLIASCVRSFLNVPFTLLRTEERAKSFAMISVSRFLTNMILKVLFVAVLKWNIHGIVMVDLITSLFFTAAFLPITWRRVSLRLNLQMLKKLLAFGLPKVPHNMAHHLLNQADRFLIGKFINLSAIGIYGVGYTIGMALKFFSYAFNMAWTPHSYRIHKEKDAPYRISRLSTYNLSLQLFAAVLISTFARELLEFFNWLIVIQPKWFEALSVVPLIAFAYVFQAAYFLTNIGISISKKTKYYPVITGTALVINISLNLLLIPEFGIRGAAFTAIISYAAMACLALFFGQKFYPIPWEWRRLATIFSLSVLFVVFSQSIAGISLLPRMILKTAMIISFPFGLWILGFFLKSEKELMAKTLLSFVKHKTR